MSDNGNPSQPARSLVKKLCEIMDAVGYVQKTGVNKFHGYKYATEADLVEMIRGEFAKRHVFVFPDVVEYTRLPLEVESKNGVRKTQISEVKIAWTFVDGESGEERTVHVHGVGEDNVDKGFYKAFTGSEKYLLMKSFLIPTGDDPESDHERGDQMLGKSQNGDTLTSAKPVDRTVTLAPYKENYLAISGPGWPLMELDGPTKAALGFRWEGSVAMIEVKHGFEFVTLCEKHKVSTVWIDAPTHQAKPEPSPLPKANLPPFERRVEHPSEEVHAAQTAGTPIHSTKQKGGTRIDKKSGKTVNWSLLEVVWGDEAFICWDQGLWEHLVKGTGQRAELLTVPSFDKKKQATIEGIAWIGNITFTDNAPDLQQGQR